MKNHAFKAIKSPNNPAFGAKYGTKTMLLAATICVFALLSPALAWYDTDYAFKKPINLSVSSGTTPTNYQVLVNVTYDSDMKSDFGDIIFTNGSENLKLDYYLYYNTSQYAYFWVESDQALTTSDYTIWMYYGNTTKTTESNGTNTFLMFDDFEDGNINGWVNDVNNACMYAVNGTWKYMLLANDGVCNFTVSPITKNDFILEYDTQRIIGGTSAGYGAGIRISQNSSTYRYLSWLEYHPNDILLGANNNGFSGWLSLSSNSKTPITSFNEWFHVKSLRYDNGKNITIYTSLGLKNITGMNNEGYLYDNRQDAGTPGYIEARVWQTLNVTMDNIFIREYGLDPAVTFGSENTYFPVLSYVSPTPANNSNTQNENYVFVNVSSNQVLDTCLLDSFLSPNETMTVNGNYCYYNKTNLANNTYYYVKVWGNNTFGEFGVTGDLNVTINLTYYPTPAPETNYTANATVVIYANPDTSDTIVNMSCSDNGHLMIERARFNTVSVLNGSMVGYWTNSTEYVTCNYGCYSGMGLFTDGCGFPEWVNYIIAIAIIAISFILIKSFVRR